MSGPLTYKERMTYLTYDHFPVGSKWKHWSYILDKEVHYDVVEHLPNGMIKFLVTYPERHEGSDERAQHNFFSSILHMLEPLPEFSVDDIEAKDTWTLKEGFEPSSYGFYHTFPHVFIHSVTDDDVVYAPSGEGLHKLYGMSIEKFLERYEK